jgi:hypothetical protein
MTAIRFALLLSFLYSLSLGVHTDEGPGMCPHGGKHAAAASADTGSCIDPIGAPCSTATLDKGLGVDPNG